MFKFLKSLFFTEKKTTHRWNSADPFQKLDDQINKDVASLSALETQIHEAFEALDRDIDLIQVEVDEVVR